MRILIAPDKYAGTLTSGQAAAAIAAGWLRTAPADELDLAPLSDGGPGFVETMHEALGGCLEAVTVRGPLGEPAPAALLVVGSVAYVESAQACGLALTGREGPRRATTHGVGELLLAAIDAGATEVVVGLGGSGTTDGGAGLLAALGATADRPLDAGPDGLAGVTEVDLTAARAAVAGISLVAASDVDNPLTGLFGAAKVFGPQKGLADADLPAVDGALQDLAAATDRKAAAGKGAGAAGGLGFALALLGAVRRPGFEVVAEATGLAGRAAVADLVVTGEGAFDFTSRGGKVPAGVAALAGEHARPCVVLAGRVEVGSREMRALGVESAYAMVDRAGSRALDEPAAVLEELAAHVATQWSR
ncbi:glycerate kinase family protein [Nocardioides jiangxiensis]|uniref:Glycerate kinase n=1 Tax=Nocardioides jiangxiensis TaxID=3064524 RepID=A0ABT9B3G1_9ACTN|nr:glycerate kinase [Nocardioides sp. WY-20]MDO7869257.1 glycerate kinase [Nocardioides sp. WY-20]